MSLSFCAIYCTLSVFSHESALFPYTERTICDMIRSEIEMQIF